MSSNLGDSTFVFGPSLLFATFLVYVVSSLYCGIGVFRNFLVSTTIVFEAFLSNGILLYLERRQI